MNDATVYELVDIFVGDTWETVRFQSCDQCGESAVSDWMPIENHGGSTGWTTERFCVMGVCSRSPEPWP